MHGNRFFIVEALVEVLAFEHLRDGVLRGQADEILGGKFRKPAAVEIDHRFFGTENFENLRLVSLGVLCDLLARQRRARRRATRRIADHSGKVAD